MRFCGWLGWRLDCLCGGLRTVLATGIKGDNLHGGAGAHFLDTLNDYAIAGCKTEETSHLSPMARST